MMKIGDIDINPLAAESLGVRSLCTRIKTPDISILLDPSAALAKRYGLEPHPVEYQTLQNVLEKIRTTAASADIISVSHYHYDHVRPGFTDCLYNLSTKDERKETLKGKVIHAKDFRENINPSQRRRAFFFRKDIKPIAGDLQWVDGKQFTFGETTISYSRPLPHGPTGSPLGYVLATTIEYSETRFLFAPDVQGPVARESLSYILTQEPDVAIIGGPPIYLSKISNEDLQASLYSLSNIASAISTLTVDHHIIRDPNWSEWLQPVRNAARVSGNRILTMAELAGVQNRCLESERVNLYKSNPPTEEFMNWANGTNEYKVQNMPPI
jgi:predicted metallo-beta-lactamase superfamily hydrolase